MPRRFALLVAVCVICCAPVAGQGAVGFRQLTTVFPVAVQRGKTATVQVRSNFTLDGTYRVFFNHPGLKMSLAEPKPVEAPHKGRGTPGTPFRFTVETPAEQLPGIYEVRMATPQAVSSVTHLLVTDYPVVEEQASPNNQQSDAQTFELPAAVCGAIEKAEDVDFYRFTGKRGQRVFFNVYSQRVTAAVHDMLARGGYHLDPIITLYDAYGTVIGQNDNFFGGDSLLVATLPADGVYSIEMRDTRYVGDPRHTYCIEIGTQPVALATFPLAVERGQTTNGSLILAGVDESPKVELSAAKNAATGWTPRRFELAGAQSNPVSVGVSDDKQLVQDGSEPGKPLSVDVPVGISGRLASAGDEHRYEFEAKKGERFTLSVTAKRLGLPIDSIIDVIDVTGKKLMEGDDQQYTSDAKMTFLAPADGRYTVRVRDLLGRGGPAYAYHLAIVRTGPDFQLQGRFYYSMLAPGTNMIWFAKLNRLNGFTGPVEVHVDNLPAGVTFTPLTIPAGMDHGAMILSAAADAKIDAQLAHVWAKGTYEEAGKTHELIRDGLITCELQSQGGGQGFWPIDTSLVGVVEPMDLVKVVAKPTSITLPRKGKVDVTVRIERNKNYQDIVSLEWSYIYFKAKLGEQLPPGVTLTPGSQTRLQGKTLEAKLGLVADGDALLVKDLPIAALCGVSISFSIDTLYASNPILLTVTDGPSKPAAAKPAAAEKKKSK